MRKVVHQQTKGRIRVTVFDDDTARIDGLVSGKIVSINTDRPQKNSNDKVFYVATVETNDGETGTAIIWENQLTTDKLPKGTFDPGMPIRVAVQLKGDYAGNATVEVPIIKEEEEEEEENVIEVEEVKLPWLVDQKNLEEEEKKAIIKDMGFQLDHIIERYREKNANKGMMEVLDTTHLIFSYTEDERFTLMELNLLDEDIEEICNKVRSEAKLKHLGI